MICNFVTVLKKYRSGIFHDKAVTGKDTGQIHAVYPHLIVVGIISLKVTDTSEIGTVQMTK